MSRAAHPPSGPDIDVLADLSADLVPAAEGRSARAHVDRCPECAAVLQALERTGSELRWLPPLAMPPDVVARIDDALAAEGTVVSMGQLRDRRRRRQQLLGIAAAGVIVLGGGGVLVSQLGGDSPETDSSVAAEGGDNAPDAPTPELSSYDQESLSDAVAGLVTRGDSDDPLSLDGPAGPEKCVDTAQLEGTDELIGVIEIRFEGRNADAVFFTTADPTLARVVVVDDCSVEEPQLLGTVVGSL